MPRSTLWLLAAVLLAGCGGPTPDDLVKRSLGCWTEAAALLETVRDEAGLAGIEPGLMEIGRRLADLNAQAAVHALQPDQVAELTRSNRRESAVAIGRFNEAAREVSTIPGGRELVMRFRRLAAQK